MSSQGPYSRPGYSGQGGGGAGQDPNYSAGGGAGGYGGGYGASPQTGYAGASYSAPAPPGGGYSQYSAGGGGGGGMGYGDGNDDNEKKSGKRSLAVQALNQNVLMWAGFFTFTIFVYYLLSGKDFSFLMTYGAMGRMFGFGILNVKTYKSGKATGVSVKSLQLYCIVFLFRLTSILRHEGYLPYDKTGDWLYHLIEMVALIFSGSALYGCMFLFKASYQADLDKFGEFNVPPGFGAAYLAVPIFILAVFIHPNLNNDFFSDMAWVYAMYLESVALLPQLYMFQKMASGVVELLTAHFVAALGIGRLIEFCFWIYSYKELATNSGSRMPGYIAIFSQFMQLVLMVDFFWYYYQAVKNATPLVLPSHGGALGIV